VVCMCDSRDTIILPCRHLCLCNACADSLRYQANNCPICRAPFRALLQVSSYYLPVLRIRDVYPGSRIQDLNFLHPGSRNPGQQLSHLPRSLQGSSPGTGTTNYQCVAVPGWLSLERYRRKKTSKKVSKLRSIAELRAFHGSILSLIVFLTLPRFGRCRRRVTRRPTPPWPANRNRTAFRPATSSSPSSRLSTNLSSTMPPLPLLPRCSCSTAATVLPALWRRRAVELITRNDRSAADLKIRSTVPPHPRHVIIAARGWERRGAAPPRHQWRIPGKKKIIVLLMGSFMYMSFQGPVQ
jgi:hypothetical protein